MTMGDYEYAFEDPYAPKDVSHANGNTAENQVDDEYARYLQQLQEEENAQLALQHELEKQRELQQQEQAPPNPPSSEYYEEEVTVEDEEVSIEEVTVEDDDGVSREEEKQPDPEPEIGVELSIIHQHLVRGDWEALVAYLQELKDVDPLLVHEALSGVDGKDKNPFHIAAWKAPYSVLKQLVGTLPAEYREPLLMKQDSEGNTPLHWACSTLKLNEDGSLDAGSLRVFTKNAPRSQEVMNWMGDCPLHLLLTSPAFAGTAGEIEPSHVEMVEGIVSSILEKYPNLSSIQNFQGATILHTALSHGVHERVLLSLLGQVPPTIVKKEDKAGRLPLHCLAACDKGKGSVPITVAAKLVELYPNSLMMPCNTGDTPLHLLASNVTKNTDMEYRKNPNTAKLAKLLLGTATDETDCPLLVQNREKFYSPLHCCALFSAPTEVIFVLMSSPFAQKAFSMLDGKKASPFHLSCASSYVGESTEVVEIFGTKEGAVMPDEKGRTPLHIAAENKHSTKAIIKVLADINPKAAKIETTDKLMPLHCAIRSKADESVTKSLFKMYPKAAKTVFEGNNMILHEACQYKAAPAFVRALLKEYPELAEIQNKFGNVPLHVATAYQCPAEVVEMLLITFPDGAMIKNRNGDVPLHYAASFPQSVDSAKLLVEAAPTAAAEANEGGDTPYDMAKSSKIERSVLKLLKRAAKKGIEGYESSGSLDTLEKHKSPKIRGKRRESRKEGSINFEEVIETSRKKGSKKSKDDRDNGSSGSLHVSDLGLETSSHSPKKKKRSKKSQKDDSSDGSDSEEESESVREKKDKRTSKAATLKAATLAVITAQRAQKRAEKKLAASMSLLQMEKEKVKKPKTRKSLFDVVDMAMEKEGKPLKSKKRESQRIPESTSSLETKPRSKGWGKLRASVLKNNAPPPKSPRPSNTSKLNVTIVEEKVRSPPGRGKSSDEILSPSGRRRRASKSPAMKARASISGGLPTAPMLSTSDHKKRHPKGGASGGLLDDMLEDVVHPGSTRFFPKAYD